MPQRVWTEDETLLAFRLYCLTPFGRIHKGNPEIIQLATVLGRQPGALAMKMLNIASHDPAVLARGRVGLKHGGRRDGEIWDKFHARMSDLYWASEQALRRISRDRQAEGQEVITSGGRLFTGLREFQGATEVLREVPVRRAQRFFRDTVLTSYNYTCAVSGIDKPELLIASHIIPWSKDPDRRSDPRNGIALSALHDRALDRGLISFTEAHELLVSSKLKSGRANPILQTAILELEGKHVEAVQRFAPDPLALAYHRERIYKPA